MSKQNILTNWANRQLTSMYKLMELERKAEALQRIAVEHDDSADTTYAAFSKHIRRMIDTTERQIVDLELIMDNIDSAAHALVKGEDK